MPVEIRCRYTTGTYVATVKGQKMTASNTISARHAAEPIANINSRAYTLPVTAKSVAGIGVLNLQERIDTR